MLTSVLLGMSFGALAAAVAWLLILTRQIARLETERSVLVDRLLIKAGQAPITFQHEQVVKVPDFNATPPPNPFQELYEADCILEEAERIRPSCRGKSLDQIKETDPSLYQEAVRAYQATTQFLRT